MELMHLRSLHLLHRSRDAFLRRRLGYLDVEPRLLPLLCRLHGAGLTRQEDLCADSGLDKSTIARGIQRLVELGYVARERQPGDRRSYHISLTEKAGALAPLLHAAMQEWADALTADFSQEDVLRLGGYLQRVVQNADNVRRQVERDQT